MDTARRQEPAITIDDQTDLAVGSGLSHFATARLFYSRKLLTFATCRNHYFVDIGYVEYGNFTGQIVNQHAPGHLVVLAHQVLLAFGDKEVVARTLDKGVHLSIGSCIFPFAHPLVTGVFCTSYCGPASRYEKRVRNKCFHVAAVIRNMRLVARNG